MKSGSEQAEADTGEKPRGTRIQSVARGCRLLMWLADRPHGATAKEVAFANRLALATTYHILNTLLDQGLLAKDARRRYVLGDGTATLAQSCLRGSAVSDSMLTSLRQIAARTQTTAYLADWGERDMRMLASVEPASQPRIADVTRGSLADAHARANGKVLLAYADRHVREDHLAAHSPRRLTDATLCDSAAVDQALAGVREHGYAVDDEEFAAGVSCVAAPVLRDGRIVAALGVSMPTQVLRQRRPAMIAVVTEFARAAG
jgi:IclR family acetate operon transcriptional repressor